MHWWDRTNGVSSLMSVASSAIEETLAKAEAAVERGEGLSGTGFWEAVSQVKRDPRLVDEYADRIAKIDSRALRDWALLIVPLWMGTAISVGATVGGLGLIWWAYSLEETAAAVVFLIGTGVLLGATHGLAHLVVGTLMGMRFLFWFVGQVTQPQPGVKVDYATYLRTPARQRAWMHASGALTTKLIPFLLIGAAIAADLPTWGVAILLVLAVGQVVTDAVWSTRASDWKKFKREMGFAQAS